MEAYLHARAARQLTLLTFPILALSPLIRRHGISLEFPGDLLLLFALPPPSIPLRWASKRNGRQPRRRRPG